MASISDVIHALEDALDAAEAILDGGDRRDAAVRAIAEIQRGEITNAVTTLEREFLPKWPDGAACEAAYQEARARCPNTMEMF